MTSIEQLNERFGISGELSFLQDKSGLVLVEINNAQASARLCLQGAQMLEWAPKGQAPVIWFSPKAVYSQGKSVRGGVPICWPWFGPHASDASLPAHGIARTASWEVVSAEKADNATKLLLQLAITEAMQAFWPYSCQLQLAVSVGETLNLELITRNTGSEPFTITEALHTYFAVSDINEIAVHGLDGVEHVDKVHGGRHTQAGPITFAGETDRVYLNTTSTCEIEDKGLKRKIIIEKTGSQSTVVWNPWTEKAANMADMGADGYKEFVCVESANALENGVSVLPGEARVLSVTYSVTPL